MLMLFKSDDGDYFHRIISDEGEERDSLILDLICGDPLYLRQYRNHRLAAGDGDKPLKEYNLAIYADLVKETFEVLHFGRVLGTYEFDDPELFDYQVIESIETACRIEDIE